MQNFNFLAIVSVAVHTGYSLTWLESPEDRFSSVKAQMDPDHTAPMDWQTYEWSKYTWIS